MPILAFVLAGPKEAPSLTELLTAAGCSTRTAASLAEVKDQLPHFPARLAVAEWGVVVRDPHLFASLRKLCQGLKIILIAPQSMLVDARDVLKEHDTLLPLPLDEEALRSAVARSQGGKAAAFFGALLSMPAKMMARAKASRDSQASGAAERARSRVFEGFHAAMAGKLIVVTAGLDLWDRISELEAHWHRLKGDEDANPDEYLVLAERYQQVYAHMAAVAQSGTTGSMRKRQPHEVDLACLQGLFERVREGNVAPTHLHEAWRVWNLPPEQREKNELFQLLWMAKRRKSGSSQRIKKVSDSAQERAADLIKVPTESQKLKRVKGSSESQKTRAKRSGESQGMRKAKADATKADPPAGGAPSAAPVPPAATPASSAARTALASASDAARAETPTAPASEAAPQPAEASPLWSLDEPADETPTSPLDGPADDAPEWPLDGPADEAPAWPGAPAEGPPGSSAWPLDDPADETPASIPPPPQIMALAAPVAKAAPERPEKGGSASPPEAAAPPAKPTPAADLAPAAAPTPAAKQPAAQAPAALPPALVDAVQAPDQPSAEPAAPVTEALVGPERAPQTIPSAEKPLSNAPTGKVRKAVRPPTSWKKPDG